MNRSDKYDSDNMGLENQARILLDESVENLSPDVTRRLQQARNIALESAKPRSLWSYYPQALTVMFALVVISMSLSFSPEFNNTGSDTTTDIAMAIESEIEMLTANENIDFMEDLEFMQWLVEIEEYAS